jgi:hypothetical protein
MTDNSAANPLVRGVEVGLEGWRATELGLRMNEYSFIIVHWHGLKLNGFDEAVRL